VPELVEAEVYPAHREAETGCPVRTGVHSKGKELEIYCASLYAPLQVMKESLKRADWVDVQPLDPWQRARSRRSGSLWRRAG
jgi:hypothetical protein